MQLASFIFFSLFLSSYLSAATVTTVKGKSVVISLSDETVEKGQKVELFDNNKKKRGIIQISKVNSSGTKAVGKLIVGKAQKGWTTDAGTDETVTPKASGPKKTTYGVSVGFSMDSMTVTLVDVGDVDLSGSGYSVKGVFDFPFTESLQVRGKAGAEFFSASGDTTDVDSPCTTCDVDITYFTLEGLAQYYLSNGRYSFWVGAGGAIMHPTSGTSNAINTDSLSTTSAIQLGGGLDIKTKSGYVPVEVVYSMLPESDSVSATYLGINIGYMW